MSKSFTESIVEDAVLAWLESLGYAVLHLPAPCTATRQAGGPDIASGELRVKSVESIAEATA